MSERSSINVELANDVPGEAASFLHDPRSELFGMKHGKLRVNIQAKQNRSRGRVDDRQSLAPSWGRGRGEESRGRRQAPWEEADDAHGRSGHAHKHEGRSCARHSRVHAFRKRERVNGENGRLNERQGQSGVSIIHHSRSASPGHLFMTCRQKTAKRKPTP